MIDLVEYLHDIADDSMGLEPEDRLILGECAARITELEATLGDFRESNRILRLDRDDFTAQQEAVNLLPEMWREASAKGQTNECYAIAQCADELDKAIGEGEK